MKCFITILALVDGIGQTGGISAGEGWGEVGWLDVWTILGDAGSTGGKDEDSTNTKSKGEKIRWLL